MSTGTRVNGDGVECGIMYAIGLRYMFGLSAFFMLAQLTLAYILIHQRRKLNIK